MKRETHLSTQIVPEFTKKWPKFEIKLMISEQLKFFLAKYLTSKSGGDYTEIELWIQPNQALALGAPWNIWRFPSFDRFSFSPSPTLMITIE